MPISINQNELKIRDENGNYQGINVFSNGETSAEMLAAIEAKAAEAIDSIPGDYGIDYRIKKTSMDSL